MLLLLLLLLVGSACEAAFLRRRSLPQAAPPTPRPPLGVTTLLLGFAAAVDMAQRSARSARRAQPAARPAGAASHSSSAAPGVRAAVGASASWPRAPALPPRASPRARRTKAQKMLERVPHRDLRPSAPPRRRAAAPGLLTLAAFLCHPRAAWRAAARRPSGMRPPLSRTRHWPLRPRHGRQPRQGRRPCQPKLRQWRRRPCLRWGTRSAPPLSTAVGRRACVWCNTC